MIALPTPRRALACALLFSVSLCVPARAQTTSSATYSREAVAADHELASRAGAEMLRAGGNAVDAAVAASFTLSVVRPESCGIGGGGFMLIALPATDTRPAVELALNYRETAPAWTTPDYFVDHANPEASFRGARAVATPGTIPGLLYALEKFGTLDRRRVLEPAIRAAEEGFVVDAHYVRAARDTIAWFNKVPEQREERIRRFSPLWERFLGSGEIEVGAVIRNPEQAAALREIAARGVEAYTQGNVGRAIVEAVTRDGGGLTLADLASYTPREMEPLRGSFLGRTIITMPPPSSGGIVILGALGVLEQRPDRAALVSAGFESGDFLHVLAETQTHGFADRARWLWDPFRAPVPVAALLDPKMLASRALSIGPTRTLAPAAYGLTEIPGLRASLATADDHGTSHLSVIDERGGAVACTETINLTFGSFLVAHGFPLNNQIDDFTTKPGAANEFGLIQSDRNLPTPGQRPLSSMSPTIVRDAAGNIELAVGASGGPRIISATLDAIVRRVMFGASVAESINAPRIHHQWSPMRLELEPALARGDLARSLRDRGHTITTRDQIAAAQAVGVRTRAGERVIEAASDPRKGGVPAGR
ncbi:MAG: gamma-glutamyltransferase [Planctomycetota bacterium]|nr:gamma-glutamyltransferase [Planctomycetota bacterium]